MSDKKYCLLCGKKIGMWDKQCQYCGENQFGENNEYYPTGRHMSEAEKMFTKKKQKPVKEREEMFNDTEKLMFGMYANEEHKKLLKLKVFGKLKK